MNWTDPLGQNPAVIGVVIVGGAVIIEEVVTAAAAVTAAIVASTVLTSDNADVTTKECTSDCQPGCPPCQTIYGKYIPRGTIAYRKLDTPAQPQHGIDGPHYNIYVAEQAPLGTPKPCQCFWAGLGAVKQGELPIGAIPIEPFVQLYP